MPKAWHAVCLTPLPLIPPRHPFGTLLEQAADPPPPPIPPSPRHPSGTLLEQAAAAAAAAQGGGAAAGGGEQAGHACGGVIVPALPSAPLLVNCASRTTVVHNAEASGPLR